MGGRTGRKWLFRALVSLCLATLLLAVGTIAYAAHVRASAKALIDAAGRIRSRADVEQQARIWQRARGYSEFVSPDGTERGYQMEVRSGWLSTFRLVPSTGVLLQVSTRSNILERVVLGMYNEQSSVWVQRASLTTTSHIWLQRDRAGVPAKVLVMLGSAADESTLAKAFALNANCMVKLGGCKNAQEMLPSVSQLEK